MIGSVVRDLQVLWRADTLIGKVWVDVIVRRVGLMAFAGLIAVFGLGMSNVAGLYALQPTVGPVWAAGIVAAIDFALGLIVLFFARLFVGPGREIELAFDVRKMAVEALQVDAHELKLAVDTLGQEIRSVKEALVDFAHNPLDIAAQKLLIPATLSIIRGLRSRKQEG
jgi:hypothetical protein